jgi:glutamate racemase
MWVPLIENNEHQKEGADFFVKQHLNNLIEQDKDIDTILLGCTHYPLLEEKIKSNIYLLRNKVAFTRTYCC